ncbi:tetratricopeptide repeat protein [Singulisphaera rosea]
MRHSRMWQAAMVTIAWASTALAEDVVKDPWIGRKVFTKVGTVLKVGNEVVDDEGVAKSLAVSGTRRQSVRVYRVERVNGEWLWLQDEASGTSGWVQAKQIIFHEKAADYYSDRILSNPNDAGHYVCRGSVRIAKEEYEAAIEDFDRAIRLNPGLSAAYYNRGIAWEMTGDYAKAISGYSEAIELDPKYVKAYTARGNAWACRKDFARAIADYDEAIRLDPKFAKAYSVRAWLWSTCPEETFRDGPKAVESATLACELNGWKDPFALNALAAACAEAGDFARAVGCQQKAIAFHSGPDKSGWQERLEGYRAKTPHRGTE